MYRQVAAVLEKGHNQLNSVSRDAGHNECVFTHKEWEQLTELTEILLPFKEYTDILQGEEVCIVSLVSCHAMSLLHVALTSKLLLRSFILKETHNLTLV